MLSLRSFYTNSPSLLDYFFFQLLKIHPARLDRKGPRRAFVLPSVYPNGISGCAASPIIGYRRCQIKDWPDRVVESIHSADIQATRTVHPEGVTGTTRGARNCPFYKSHVHPVIIPGTTIRTHICCPITWPCRKAIIVCIH